jgi:hypothetical protein
VPVSTYLNNPRFKERYQNDPNFLCSQERAAAFLYAQAMRVAGILLAVIGGYGGARQETTLKSLVAGAGQAAFEFYQSQFEGTSAPLQMACKGPDNLALSTGNLPRLKTLFIELLAEIRYWSKSLSVEWAEDHQRLGLPAARILLTFEGLVGQPQRIVGLFVRVMDSPFSAREPGAARPPECRRLWKGPEPTRTGLTNRGFRRSRRE